LWLLVSSIIECSVGKRFGNVLEEVMDKSRTEKSQRIFREEKRKSDNRLKGGRESMLPGMLGCFTCTSSCLSKGGDLASLPGNGLGGFDPRQLCGAHHGDTLRGPDPGLSAHLKKSACSAESSAYNG
jgi:hypothetical protein